MTFPDADFEFFFHAHYDQLVRSLTAMTGDRELARDSVQEAFVKASTRWGMVQRLDNPVTWVRRVAINRSRDAYRAARRRKQRELRDSQSGRVGHLDPTSAISDASGALQLLDQLPAQQRRAAVLFYIDDLPLTEIAEHMNITVGAVKYHLHQARTTLRSLLQPASASNR